eukprot:TRINITY_DN424_c0_g1_i1.p1 TRINITY_DN424_c0_g1~~TRINITY_DN424_c0_g1_i1.p1  ORF type:complete len:2708 (-),score=170.36 TRINITY_DN424_c0_g1_i1:63-8186(-)
MEKEHTLNPNLKLRVHKPALHPRRTRLETSFRSQSRSPYHSRRMRLRRLQLMLPRDRDLHPIKKPAEDPRGSIFHFLKEPLGLIILIVATTAISFNFVNLLLLVFALIQCKLAYQTSYSGIKRAYLTSLIGLCLSIVLCGLQIYATVAVFVHGIYPEMEESVIGKLIRAIGVTMSSRKSAGRNVGAAFKCFVPTLIAIIAFIWLIAFYKYEKDAKRRNKPTKPPPHGLVWFYSPKPWCYVCLSAMLLSACLNISASGAIFFVLAFCTVLQWTMDNPVDSVFKVSAIIAISLASVIAIVSCLLRLTIVYNAMTGVLPILKSLGVQLFDPFDAVSIAHFSMIICISVSGIFYLQMQNYEYEQPAPLLQKLPSVPVVIHQPIPLESPRTVRDEPQIDIQPLLSVRARMPSHSPTFTFPPSPENPLSRPKEKKKSIFAQLNEIIKEYVLTPYFFIYVSQILTLIWILRFNSLWTIPQLLWLGYSTLHGTRIHRFMYLTKYLFFPYMIVNTTLLYLVNIYGMPYPDTHIDRYETFGLLLIREDPYTIFFFDFLLMVSTLISLCMVIKYQNELQSSEKKRKTLSKLFKEYPNVEQVFVIILKNLDKGIIVLLYFQGIRAVSLLHAGLVAYFLLFFIYPTTGRRCFVFLLLYVEVFLSLQIIYGMFSYLVMDSDSQNTIETIAVITGVYVELFTDAAVGRVNIQPSLVFLIVLIYLQYKLYNSSLYDYQGDYHISTSMNSYSPKGVAYTLMFIKNCASWLYIWVAYIVFFVIIITTNATLINSIFLVLILTATTIHLWNETTTGNSGYKRTRQVWIIMVLYCGIVVFTLYVFQFFGIRILRMFVNVFYFPEQFVDNMNVIGYEQFKDDDRWLSFFPYFVLLFLSVIASRQVHNVQQEEEEEPDNLIQLPTQSKIKMDSAFFLKKIKPLWGFFDHASSYIFDVLAITMLLFAIFWKLSLATASILIIICCYYFSLHSTTYKDAIESYGELGRVSTLSQAQESLKVSASHYKENLISTRKKYWKVLYITFIVCIFLSYMSRFIEVVYTHQLPYSTNVLSMAKWFFVTRFMALWSGFYHGELSKTATFGQDCLGYFLLFILLLIEWKAIQWYHNRMNIENEPRMDPGESVEPIDDTTHCLPIEDLFENGRSMRGNAETFTLSVEEDQYGKELFKSLLVSLAVQYYRIVYKKSKVTEYYQFLSMKAVKNLLEDAVLFLAVIACVLKENVFIILYIPFLFVFLKHGSTIRITLWLHDFFVLLIILQYLLSIFTFSSETAPQSRHYPTIDSDCNEVLQAFGIIGRCPFYSNLRGWNGWANYLAIGDSRRKLYYLFIDCITLVLFSVYFRYFCNPSYEEDILPEGAENPPPESRSESDASVVGPLKQAQLNALEKRSKQRSIFVAFCDVAGIFLFYYLHVLILFVILILATRSQGLIAIGYLVFCLFFLFHNRQFAENEKAWKYPPWMRYFLQPYLLFDIISQFVIQMPFEGKGTTDAWEIIFIIQPLATNATIILKLLIFTMVSLQSKIFRSGEFVRFTIQKARSHREISQLKGLCCTYLYNNRRICRYKKYEQQKERHSEKLEKIKEQIEEWNKKLNNPDSAHTLLQLRRITGLKKPGPRASFIDLPKSPARENLDTSRQLDNIIILLENEKELRQSAIRDFIGPLGKLYIWLHSKINHVLFKNGEKLERLFDDAERGASTVLSRLEKMAIECERTKLLIEKEKLEAKLGVIQEEVKFGYEESPVNVKKLEIKLKKLQEEIIAFLKFSHMLKHYWLCLYRLILSSTQFYCFFFMILAHLFGGSILSVVYPISVFIYGLVEYCRPRWGYWTFVLVYTEIVLALKVIIQLDAINYWIIDRERLNDEYFLNAHRIGLKVFDSTVSSEFFKYIVFECLIILSTLIHQYVLIFLGVYTKREIDQESISAAIDRVSHKGEVESLSEVHSEGKGEPKEYPPKRTFSLPHETEKPSEEEKLHTTTIGLEWNDSPRVLKRQESGQVQRDLMELEDSRIEDEDKVKKEKKGVSGKEKNGFAKCLRYVAFENPYSKTMFPRLKVSSFLLLHQKQIEKPGVDYSNKILYTQLLIAIFIILFYARMSADYENVSQALSYFIFPLTNKTRFKEFSGEMIIVLLLHIIIIIWERYLYLKDFSGSATKEDDLEEKLKKILREKREKEGLSDLSDDDIENLTSDELEQLKLQSYKEQMYPNYNYGLLLKFLLQCVLLGLIMYMIFWYFPNEGNVKLLGTPICITTSEQCNEVTSNIWIMIFYLLFCVYFALSAHQIREGWPEIRNIKTLRKKVSLMNSMLVRLYLGAPFLFELHLIMDWAFTKTSLDVFQWFKFDEVHANAYLSKYIYSTYYPLGKAISGIFKFLVSSSGLFAIILLIVGPMIIFSSLNPIAQDNKITGAAIAFGIYVNQQINTFELFSTSQIVSLMDMNSTRFIKEGLHRVDEIKTANLNSIQIVEMQKYSDTEWRPTTQAKDLLLKYLNSSTTEETKFYLSYSFRRNYKSEYARSQNLFVQDINSTVKNKLYETIRNCQYYSTVLPNFYNKIIRLPADEPARVVGGGNPNIVEQNLTLTLNCTNIVIRDGNNTYAFPTYSWELSAGKEGVDFITWSEQVTTVILGYTAFTLYISVVIVIGNFIKGATRGGSTAIIISDMPEPDGILNLCEGVIIYRLENNLKMEAELYYTLIDIFRSPEILKIITGSSLTAIKKKPQQFHHLSY